MTLSEIRKKKEPEHPGVAARQAGDRPHPGPRLYVTVGVLLALGEASEVAMFYSGLPQWPTVAVLVALMVVNFSMVVLWFMHLLYDDRFLSSLFVGGLVLTGALFVVVLATLGSGLF